MTQAMVTVQPTAALCHRWRTGSLCTGLTIASEQCLGRCNAKYVPVT
jgi:hypothetical protein